MGEQVGCLRFPDFAQARGLAGGRDPRWRRVLDKRRTQLLRERLPSIAETISAHLPRDSSAHRAACHPEGL